MFFGNRLHRFFLLIAIILTALSSACSAIITERTIETESPLEEIQVRSVSEPVLRAIPVETVGIQIGVGSPIPVEVVVSGTWPDLCAQLAQINQQVDGSHIEVELLASPLDSSCPPDYLGLPMVHACGGSWLVKKQLIADGDFGEIEKRTAAAVRIVQQVRGVG